MPLQYALTEFKGHRDKLLELLSCLNKAADVSELIGGFVRSGEMFHPLRLTSDEAYRFLKDCSGHRKSRYRLQNSQLVEKEFSKSLHER